MNCKSTKTGKELTIADIGQISVEKIDPAHCSSAKYIGLEHIEVNSLKLNGFGLASQVQSQKNIFQKGDILFGKLRPYFRKIVVAPFDGICSTDILVIRPQKDFDRNFLFYLISSKKAIDFATRTSIGTRMPRAKWQTFKTFSIKVTSKREQKFIGTCLSSLDKKIELNRRMNETLEAMAQALFKDWFVDFGPTRAKMEGRQPYLPVDIWSLFPSRLSNEGIPKGWQKKPLGSLIELTKGRSYKKIELKKSSNALVTLKSFNRGGGYRLDGLKSYIGSYKPEQVVNLGDLVIALTDVTQAADVIGKPALIFFDDGFEKLIASLDVGIVKSNYLDKSYLYCLMKTENFSNYIIGQSIGTTVLHLGKDSIYNFQAIIPSDEIRRMFSETADRLFQKIIGNTQESQTLAEMRDLLLPRLMSGQLRVATTGQQNGDNL